MKLLFIDSDVLLDVILIRDLHFNNSAEIMKLAGNEKYMFCTSVHCLLNIHYATKKRVGEKLARQAVKALTEKLTIVTEDFKIVEQAINSDFTDFEDAVQFYAAKSIAADIIITRNTKDYKQCTIPVSTPDEFLRTLSIA